MRVFRVKATNHGRYANQRIYLGVDKLLKYGSEVINRYNSYATALVQERIDNKWVNCVDEMRMVQGGAVVTIGSELVAPPLTPKIVIHIDGDYLLLIDK